MAYSYLTKLYLETELCYEWAILGKMRGLASDLMTISKRQMNTAILDECRPELTPYIPSYLPDRSTLIRIKGHLDSNREWVND